MPTFEQTYTLGAGARVQIHQRSGNVRVVTWDRPEIFLKAVSAGDEPAEDRVRVFQSSHTLEIEVRDSEGWFVFGRRPAVDFELSVPPGTPLQIEAGSGDVTVDGTVAPVVVETGSGNIRMSGVFATTVEAGSGDVHLTRVGGAVRLETGSGNVTVNEVHGPVELEVGSGDVALRAVYGTISAETGSGNLSVAEVKGQVQLESGSGDIFVRQISGPGLNVSTGGGTVRLEQLDIGRMEVESGNGDIWVELVSVHPGGRYWIESSSGNVNVAVPPAAGLAVRVESSGGGIRHEGLDLRTTRADRGELEAVLGNGSARLEIESGSGRVSLKPCHGLVPEPVPGAGNALMQAIHQDSALESSEQVQRIVQMVQEGKLSPEEAEQLLSALDEEVASS